MQDKAQAGAEITVPIGRVQAAAALAVQRGWDVEAILQSIGISSEVLGEGRSRVTVEQFAAMIRQLWRVTDDELLGFGLEPVPRGTFRMMCFGLLGAGDVAGAIGRFQQFNRAVPGIPPVLLSTEAGMATLTVDISEIQRPVDLLVDTLLVVAHRFIGWAIGQRVPLDHVEVPYPEPTGVDDYDVAFGAPVRFSAPAPALVFNAEVLSWRLVRDEPSLIDFLRDTPATVLTNRDYSTSVAHQVRRRLAQGLTGDWPNIDQVAAEMAMSPQTLRRKLREEQTSLREIREALMRDAAITSLVRGNETVAALSRRLGFSEPSAFSRAFRRWTGSPPGSYQR